MYPSVQSDTAYKILDKEGDRRYELSNHLGNILAVISDRKTGLGTGINYTSFAAITTSATDYFPFGMSMPGRSFTAANTEGYRYSFNGKEDDTEWAKQDYGMRIYDKRIGKFLSVDPLTAQYPELTPYQFASNTPIMAIDLDGTEMLQAIRKFFFGKMEAMATGTPLKQINQPVIKVIYSETVAYSIAQTGCQVTKITSVTVSVNGKSESFVGYNAGMDICTDGSGPAYNDGDHQNTAALKGSWGTINASEVDYVTVPTVLLEKFNVRVGDLAVVSGQTATGQSLDKPSVVGETSGKHGGEASIHLAWAYGYGKKGGKDNAMASPSRGCQFQYWYALNSSDTPNATYAQFAQDNPGAPPGLCKDNCSSPTVQNSDNPRTAQVMSHLNIAKQAIENHKAGKPSPSNVTVEQKK